MAKKLKHKEYQEHKEEKILILKFFLRDRPVLCV